MTHLRKLSVAFTFALFALASCSNVDKDGIKNAQDVTERIDFKITGESNSHYNYESIEREKNNDLVSFNIYNSPNRIDFKVQLADNKYLMIKLYNIKVANPWEHAGTSYPCVPTQNQDDKWQYVIIDLYDGENSETPSFSSNLEEILPQSTILDVFRIDNYSENNKEILCRVNNMALYDNTNIEKSIEIVGTFVGALTFLDID